MSEKSMNWRWRLVVLLERDYLGVVSEELETLKWYNTNTLDGIHRGFLKSRFHVHGRRVDPSALVFSLSSHRHSYMSSV